MALTKRYNHHHSTLATWPHTVTVVLIIAVALLNASPVAAHGIVSAEVKRIESLLERSPNDVDLRIKYVASLTAVQHFDEATMQLAAIRRIDPHNDSVDWLGARNAFEAEDYQGSVIYLDRHLKNYANDGGAWELLGRALMKLAQYQRAADCFATVLQLGPLTTDRFIYAAAAQTAAGNIEPAIGTLKFGLDVLGDLPLFYLRIAELQALQRNFQAAADTVSELIESVRTPQRTEHYLALRGDYLLAAGQTSAALTAYRQALTQLRSRSARVRQTPMAQELLQKLSDRLAAGDAS